MNAERPSTPEPRYPVLERITAVVLVLVLASLAWMAVGAWQPDWTANLLEAQAWGAVVLLSSALILVSVVALLHTR
jgi:hypothetical protein